MRGERAQGRSHEARTPDIALHEEGALTELGAEKVNDLMSM